MPVRNFALAALLSCGATACLIEPGDNIELIRERSPDGVHDAVVFLRGGSAVSRPVSQVSVIAADEPATGVGNIYVAGSDLGLQPVWLAADSLVLIAAGFLDGGADIHNVDGVDVAALELPDLGGNARARELREYTLWQVEATAESMIRLWRAGEAADSLLALPYGPLTSDEARRLHYLARDAWGRKLAADVEGDSFTVSSTGPDRLAGTDDDLWLTFRR